MVTFPLLLPSPSPRCLGLLGPGMTVVDVLNRAVIEARIAPGMSGPDRTQRNALGRWSTTITVDHCGVRAQLPSIKTSVSEPNNTTAWSLFASDNSSQLPLLPQGPTLRIGRAEPIEPGKAERRRGIGEVCPDQSVPTNPLCEVAGPQRRPGWTGCSSGTRRC